jgi:methylphosphotriester-DNA--protein-cysteine methyltransferase
VETAVISNPHFRVFAEFRITGPDDDGPDAAVAQPAAATGELVAPRLGQLYCRAGCNVARRLSPANLISFAAAPEAEQAGYRRSRASGCY